MHGARIIVPGRGVPRRAARAVLGVACGLVLAAVFAGPAAAAVPFAWSTPVTVDRAVPFAVTHAITGMGCAPSGLCVGVDDAGEVVSSSHPTGPAAAWGSTTVDAQNQLDGVSCPSAALCVAVDDAGNIFSSTNPNGGGGAWTGVNADPTNSIYGVSCPSTTLCVAVDSAGKRQLARPTHRGSELVEHR